MKSLGTFTMIMPQHLVNLKALPLTDNIVDGDTLNWLTVLLPRLTYHPSTTLDTNRVHHVTSDTRSCMLLFSCNVEKLGVAWFARLYELFHY